MVTPAAKREAVAHLARAHEMSERRACQVIGCQRMTVRYRSRRHDDRRLRDRLVALARERRRFGYRRLLIFLRREGFVVNHKRLFPRLPRGTAGGTQKARPQKGPGQQDADASAGPAQRAVGAGLRVRSAGLASWRSTMSASAAAWRQSPTSRCRASGWPVSSTA